MSDIRSWSPTLISRPGDNRQRFICCRACDAAICRTDETWKERTLLDERPLRRFGDVFAGAGADVLLRRFFCPSCGTTLDTEVALPGEPFLIDRIQE
jgi:acetone carboxylase gamma subunit